MGKKKYYPQKKKPKADGSQAVSLEVPSTEKSTEEVSNKRRHSFRETFLGTSNDGSKDKVKSKVKYKTWRAFTDKLKKPKPKHYEALEEKPPKVKKRYGFKRPKEKSKDGPKTPKDEIKYGSKKPRDKVKHGFTNMLKDKFTDFGDGIMGMLKGPKDKVKGQLKKPKERPETPKDNLEEKSEKLKDKQSTTPTWKKAFPGWGGEATTKVTDETPNDTAFDPDNPNHDKPRFGRYLSGLNPFKPHLEHVNFSKQWWEETESEWVPKPAPIDPHVALQAAHSHMLKVPLTPLPASHFSGMFVLFEEYKKIRLAKDILAEKLTKLTTEKEAAQREWNEAEVQYQSEIRRLELHIAHGVTGMQGLALARMGSVVRRHRVISVKPGSERPPKTSQAEASIPAKKTMDLFGTTQKTTDDIPPGRKASRRASASESMVDMSQKLTDVGTVLPMPVGTPPTREPAPLTTKLKSELNMAKMAAAVTSAPSGSVESDCTWAGAGDALPDEVEAKKHMIDNVDGLPALRELADVVAQQRGIDPKRFISGLMRLLMEKPVSNTCEDARWRNSASQVIHPLIVSAAGALEETDSSSSDDEADTEGAGSNRPLRLGAARKAGGRFSFEAGDDKPSSATPGNPFRDPHQQNQSRNASVKTLSKTPISTHQSAYGTLRQVGSLSALTSSMGERRHSGSSVLTAFRDSNSAGIMHPANPGSLHAAEGAYERSKSDKESPH